VLTPEYASPELLLGEPAEVASDIYALGVVLNELLAGTRPLRAQAGRLADALEQAVIEARVAQAKYPAHRAGRPGAGRHGRAAGPPVARDLDAIVLKALAKRPADRYASAAALKR